MKLSTLQKYILLECLQKGHKLDRKIFRNFYHKALDPAKEKPFSFPRLDSGRVAQGKYQESIITKSLEHLIDRGLLTGYGRRTPQKWFMTQVSLTKKGAKISQNLLKERQVKLPLI